MTKSFDALKQEAEALHVKLYGLSKGDAVLEIVSAFINITEDAHRDVMDSVENKLLHKEHH